MAQEMKSRLPQPAAIRQQTGLLWSAVSASPDCLTKDVLVAPVVIPELKLRDVERHVFRADLVKRADNAAFEDRPEAFNRVRIWIAPTTFWPLAWSATPCGNSLPSGLQYKKARPTVKDPRPPAAPPGRRGVSRPGPFRRVCDAPRRTPLVQRRAKPRARVPQIRGYRLDQLRVAALVDQIE
jgi:hypothetical protein